MTRLLLVAVLASLFVGCSRAQQVQIEASAIPFTKKLRMQEGDAYEFQLPDGKTVAVWCQKPPFGMMLAEQTTQSGLKTVWGERAFRTPELERQQTGPNSYTAAGWKSYITQGGVITSGDNTTEYELFVSEWRFSITEDLRGTGVLPVTIQISRR